MVKRIFLILLALPFWAFSQNNKELRKLMELPESECEEISPNTASSLSELSFTDEANIKPLLDNWIQKCRYNEAVFRVFVLLSIQDGSLTEKDLGPDFRYYIQNFQDRANDARLSNSEKIFKQDKEYFLFIPLNSAFDKWTAAWADSLLQIPNRNGLEHFFLSLYANKKSDFVNKHLNDEKYDEVEFIRKKRIAYEKEMRETGSFFIMLGSWTPIGSLSQYLGSAPAFGVGGGALVSEKWSIEGSVLGRIPVNLQDFRISTFDSAVATKNTFSFSLNLFASYDLVQYKRFRLKPTGGIGIEFFSTDVERPDNGEEDDPGNFSITTYNLSAGLDFNFRTADYSYWGLKALYTVMDYNNGVRAVDNLGGHSMNLLLYYYF